jgi:hypothetical protein
MTNAYFGALSVLVPGVASRWDGTRNWDAPSCQPDLRAPVDARSYLAGVKHRYFNDTSRYSVAAARLCLGSDMQLAWPSVTEGRRGVIVGTTVADYAVRECVDRDLMANGGGGVNAISAPNVSSNIASAYVSIECHARAFATTLTSPFLAGLESLAMGFLSMRAGKADAILAIGAEEAMPHDDAAITPGSVCVSLQRHPGKSARAIVDIHCGHYAPGTTHPFGKNASRFLGAAAQSETITPELMVVRDRSEHSEKTAQAWLQQAAIAGLGATPREMQLDDEGAVAPLLAAAPTFTGSNRTVLLAIYRNRYVALSIA